MHERLRTENGSGRGDHRRGKEIGEAAGLFVPRPGGMGKLRRGIFSQRSEWDQIRGLNATGLAALEEGDPGANEPRGEE